MGSINISELQSNLIEEFSKEDLTAIVDGCNSTYEIPTVNLSTYRVKPTAELLGKVHSAVDRLLEVQEYLEVSLYLEMIEKYLESQLKRLRKEYEIQRGELPPQNEFSLLTKAIESVKSLESIQEIILQYRAGLGE